MCGARLNPSQALTASRERHCERVGKMFMLYIHSPPVRVYIATLMPTSFRVSINARSRRNLLIRTKYYICTNFYNFRTLLKLEKIFKTVRVEKSNFFLEDVRVIEFYSPQAMQKRNNFPSDSRRTITAKWGFLPSPYFTFILKIFLLTKRVLKCLAAVIRVAEVNFY